MKKTIYLICFSTLLAITSCTKDGDNDLTRPQCEVNNTGTLRVVCNLADPYKVYVNNAYKGTVGAYTSADFGNITAGTYSTRYEQASGYIFYPTEYTLSVTITQCNTFTANLY